MTTDPATGQRPAPKRLLHMIGNAHIDAVWLWPWQEGLQEIRATFASALARLEEYPELVFTTDSVAYLAWIARIDPQLFEAIRRRVAEGRWQLVGGWWVEPDCNIPCGESFVRQALYGQRFLAEHFGLLATAGCNVDPFGHNASLPQLLRKAGMDGYVFLRPQPHEKALPAECFWWAAPDGSRVLTYRIPYGYCSPGQDLDQFIEQVLERTDPEEPELMVFYGVGNHGGGPTKANLDSLRRLNDRSEQFEYRCSSIDEYFRRRHGEPDLPTYTGELQHHSVGCYSAHSGIKRWNRRAENLLLAAEKLACVAAQVTGLSYPQESLTQAWKLVLFNQFHDTLGGTAIEPAYQDSRDQYGYACTVAGQVMNEAAQSLAAGIDIPFQEGSSPVVVTNPLPWEVTMPVELELQGLPPGPVLVRDADGHVVGSQLAQPYATVGSQHRRLVIDATVPALGYRLYRASVSDDANLAVGGGDANVLDNGLLRVEVDPIRGWLSRCLLGEEGLELVGGASAPHAVVVEDHSDTWSHDVVSYGQGTGRFECRSVQRVEDGPVRRVLRIESTYGNSSLVEDLILARGARHLEVRVTLDWHEQQRLVKLRFPCQLHDVTATFAAPYGHVERVTEGGEEPAQAWVDVSGSISGGRRAGWSVLNDGKYGFDVQEAEIGMTVARSPVYAWHNPKKLDPAATYHYLDQGTQHFSYGLVPHRGDWRAAGTVRLAEQLNQPLSALPEHAHPGHLPAAQGFCAVESSSVVVTAVKAAEDGDAVVVRAYETTGRPGNAVIDLRFLDRRIDAVFAPSEIKTFLVPTNPKDPVRETSLLEWTDDEVIARGGASARGG